MRDDHTPKAPLRRDGPLLVERYGAHLEDDLTDKQAEEVLLALFDILSMCVRLGFSVKPGEKFHENSDLGLDDVLKYMHLEETAHETVAPPKPDNGAAQP